MNLISHFPLRCSSSTCSRRKSQQLKHPVITQTVKAVHTPGHLTSMKYELGLWTSRFSLHLLFSSSTDGCSKSLYSCTQNDVYSA